jgi:uncharacterized protein (TIGR02996 family)
MRGESPHAGLMGDPTHAALHRAVVVCPEEELPRLALADWWQEHGREDVAAMWRGTLPKRSRTRKRVDTLTDKARAAMPGWAARWIAIGLSTEPADRPLFEAAATQCYLAAKLRPPRFVWCPNPLVAVTAGSLYAIWRSRQLRGAVDGAVDGAVHSTVHSAVHDAVHGAVHGAVGGAVGDAVHDAVRGAVGGAVRGAVHDAVHGAVHDAVHGAVDGAVDGAVRDAVGGAVHDAVGGAVGGAVRDAVDGAVRGAVRGLWYRRFGGQFGIGWYYWLGSPCSVTFFLDVLRLKIPAHLELAARAHAASCVSACWWWPHREVVFVSERPHTLEVRPGRTPLVQWDGWGIGG